MVSEVEVQNGRRGPHTDGLNLEVSEVRSPLSMLLILQACEVAVVTALMSIPALHMLANARICFIPYWVSGPQLASKVRTCIPNSQELFTYMGECSVSYNQNMILLLD